MRKKCLTLLLALVMCLGLAAPAFAADSGFNIEDGVLIKYTGPGGDVTIPDSITAIKYSAFEGCTGLTSVTIPSSVTAIKANTFRDCTNLTSVTIPDSVTAIDHSAFRGCASLTDITIPDGVTHIESDTFRGCASLTSITIPDGVIGIASAAFAGCTSLTSVVLPNSVMGIGNKAFEGCTSLTSVTLPYSPTGFGLGSDAFKGCDNLKDIYTHSSRNQWFLSAESVNYATVHLTDVTLAGGFTDVKAGDYFADPVAWAAKNGITTGTTTSSFSPKQNCTHGQILTFLWRAAGEPESNATLPFATTGKEYYLGAAKWAYEKGMIGADFKHGAPCTRADAVNYIWQAAGKGAASYDGRFTDVPANSPYATAVAWAVANGVTNGATATTFNPNGICNRGQIVTFLHRYFGK